MTGKAPPSRSRKDRARNARPYDRPNQSIFGKVASTVKGLFTPSWLFNVSSWVRTNSEDINVTTDNAVEPDLTENEDEPEVSPVIPRPQGRFKRPRLECNTVPTSETPFWLGPSTSRDTLSQNVEIATTTSTIVPDCDPVHKEAPITVNGDDHSENSDGSASTSGCSSLVSSQDKPHRSSGLKLSESALELLREELKCDPSFHRKRKEAATLTTDAFFNSPRNASQGNISLWSCGTQTPGKSPQVPSLLNSSRPSFNISSFSGPSKGNSPATKMSSPFYDGNTTFGGASAYRRRQMANTPYQMKSLQSPRCQVRISSSEKELECMSSAAKRILHTLETMSTPITDAKKIPNICKSPLDISPPSHRVKSYLPLSKNSPVPSPRGPPVSGLGAVAKLSLLRNQRSRMKSSMMELPLKEKPIASLPADCSVNKSMDSSDITSRVGNTGGGGGGKMKTKLREPLHVSTKAKQADEVTPAYELPNVPLPVSALPVFKFSVKPNSEADSPKPTEGAKGEKGHSAETSKESSLPSFTFSNPIERMPPSNSLQTTNVSKDASFKFSTPLGLSPKTAVSRQKEDTQEIYSNRSINEILKSLCEKSSADETDNKEKSGSTASQEKLRVNSQTFGFGDKFKPKPGSWSCSSCLVQNEGDKDVCAACCAAKPSTASASGNKPSTTSGFGDKFKPQQGSWECPACMVRNKSDSSKCVACETPNSSQGNQTASLPKDVFKNIQSDVPTTTAPVCTFGGKLFQSTAGTWECDSCMVRNTLDKSKCVACDTLRPSKDKTSGAGKASFEKVGNNFFTTTFGSGSDKFLQGISEKKHIGSEVFNISEKSKSDSRQSLTDETKGSEETDAPAVSKAPVFSFQVGKQAQSKNDAATTSSTTFGSGNSTGFTFGASSKTGTTGFGGVEIPASAADAPPSYQKSSGFTFGASTKTDALPSKGATSIGGDVHSKSDAPATTISTTPALFSFGVSSGSLAPTTNTTSSALLGPSLTQSKEKAVGENTAAIGAVPTTKGAFSFSGTPTSGALEAKLQTLSEQSPAAVFGVGSATTADFTFGASVAPSTTSSVFGAGDAQKANPAESLTGFPKAPTFNFGASANPLQGGTTATSIGGNIHSKGESHETDPLAAAKAETKLSQTTVTTPSITNPLFSFGTSAGYQAQTTSTTSTPALFGPSLAQSQQKVSEPKDTNTALSATTAASATAASSFKSGKPMFVCFGGATEPKLQALPEPASTKSQLTVTPFSFGASSTTNAGFSFGAISAPSTTTTSIFATADAQKTQMDNATSFMKPSVFTFGAATKSEAKSLQGGFTFKPATEDKTNPAAPQHQVNFGGFKVEPANANAISSTPSSVFKFGASTPAQPSGGASTGFVFGASTKTDTAPVSNTPFTFSGQPTQGGFSCFQQLPPATSSMPAFNFSNSMTSSTPATAFNPTGSGSFSFVPKSQPSTMNPPAAVGRTVGFGSQFISGGAITPAFGTAGATPSFGSSVASSMAFGSIPAAKPEPSGGFNFSQQSSDAFSSFATPAKKAALTPPQNTGFNFMSPPMEPAANFSSNFSMNAPTNFNFGATSTPTNQPFQFAASSDITSSSASVPRKIRKAIRRGRKLD